MRPSVFRVVPILILAAIPLGRPSVLRAGEDPAPARLFIRSTPAEGELVLDREELGPTPLGIENLAPGPHDIRIGSPGFATWYQRMEIRPGHEYWIGARLSKDTKYNRLDIRSTPPGARVFLGGDYRGETPLTLFFVPAGIHPVTLLHDSLVWRGEVSLEAGDRDSLRVELSRAEGAPRADLRPTPFFVERIVRVGGSPAEEGPPGRLILTADPSGGDLYVDGEWIGRVPEEIEDLTPGFHEVRIRRKGYADWAQRMHIAPGREYPVLARLSTEAEPNRIAITSSPDGADIYLDGLFRGETPISLLYLSASEHEVTALLDSLSWSGTVSVGAQEERRIHAELAVQTSVVDVLTPLDSLRVEVDGEMVGVAPCTIRVRPGRREFVFRQGESGRSVRTLFVDVGRTLTIDVEEVLDPARYDREVGRDRGRRRWYLLSGILSAGGSVAFRVLQERAYDRYMESTTLEDIEANFDSARRNQYISFSLAGASLYPFVRYFFGRGPRPESFEKIEILGE